MTGVVYTAVIGATDPLPPAPGPIEGLAFVCITDGPDVPGWTMQRISPPAVPTAARAAARALKMRAPERFPDAAWSIWVDASFRLVDVAGLLASAVRLQAPIVGFRHPDRGRIREEARAVLQAGQAPAAAVQRQVQAYQRDGFDTDAAPQSVLTTTGILYREHTSAVAAFDALWAEQLEQFTLRDQLSVDYCARRCGLAIGYWPGHYRDNVFAVYERRRRRPRVA